MGKRARQDDSKQTNSGVMNLYSKGWADHGSKSRLRRWLEPPLPFVHNPREIIHMPLGARNLYIGGAGVRREGYINLNVPGLRRKSHARSPAWRSPDSPHRHAVLPPIPRVPPGLPAFYHRRTGGAPGLHVVAEGWRICAHGFFGWLLSPLRYLDLWLLRSPRAGRIGNHCYVWFRKPGKS
jgi:hypothetical protein